MDLDELLSTTAPSIYSLGSAFYFHPETLRVGREHGMDGLTFYVIGRGGVLGDVEPAVVGSAFGYFEPKLIAKFWERGRKKMAPRAAARLHLSCGHTFGRSVFGDLDLAGFCAAAEAVVTAVDPAAMPLFAGFSAEPLPDDAPARAVQLSVVLRELRGSAHLVAVVATGLSPLAAHALRRPDAIELFGWSTDDVPDLTGAEEEALARADALTNRLLATPYSVLDEAGRVALGRGVEAMVAAMADAGPGAAPVERPASAPRPD